MNHLNHNENLSMIVIYSQLKKSIFLKFSILPPLHSRLGQSKINQVGYWRTCQGTFDKVLLKTDLRHNYKSEINRNV